MRLQRLWKPRNARSAYKPCEQAKHAQRPTGWRAHHLSWKYRACGHSSPQKLEIVSSFPYWGMNIPELLLQERPSAQTYFQVNISEKEGDSLEKWRKKREKPILAMRAQTVTRLYCYSWHRCISDWCRQCPEWFLSGLHVISVQAGNCHGASDHCHFHQRVSVRQVLLHSQFKNMTQRGIKLWNRLTVVHCAIPTSFRDALHQVTGPGMATNQARNLIC